MTDIEVKIITALENPNFDWRTIDGIAKETGLQQEIIMGAIRNMQDTVIRSAVPDKDGRALYTTRKHYDKTQGFLTKSLSAVSGSIKR